MDNNVFAASQHVPYGKMYSAHSAAAAAAAGAAAHAAATSGIGDNGGRWDNLYCITLRKEISIKVNVCKACAV